MARIKKKIIINHINSHIYILVTNSVVDGSTGSCNLSVQVTCPTKIRTHQTSLMIRILLLFSNLEKRISASPGLSATLATVSQMLQQQENRTPCLLKVLASTTSVQITYTGLALPPSAILSLTSSV